MVGLTWFYQKNQLRELRVWLYQKNQGWGFEPGAISPNSNGEKEDMLETEFNYVANNLFNHVYV